MATGLALNETMSGHLIWGENNERKSFSISICAFTTHIFALTVPREFRGEAQLQGVSQVLPITGQLTIYPTGPEYQINIEIPGEGSYFIQGKKTYRLRGLVKSLITCPLTVYKDGEAVGEGEIVYRDSMLKFPFTALKLMSEQEAYSL